MDSSLFSFTCVIAAAIGFLMFTLFRNLRFHREDNKENNISASSPSSPPQTSLSPSPSTPPQITKTHPVFLSFRGEDVRRDFLSHFLKEFQRKGITPFIDYEIKRGESIASELMRAIRGSKIAIILLSRNYASSSWCLAELSEIMKCRKELGQTVMVVYYKVDPTDVKKLTGDFGKVLKKTCAGKSKEDIGRWRQALEEVATIAGYHSNNWDNEADMINQIGTDILNKLNNSLPSRDFDGFVGMRAHLEIMKQLLCLDSDEVRMVGIWGPPGIGKTTIAKVIYNELSNNFQMGVFMVSRDTEYKRPCFDENAAKVKLQHQFLSKITNRKDKKIDQLGVSLNYLCSIKILVVLDGVDSLVQLDAMAADKSWFGPGSRIIVISQHKYPFLAHGMDYIYHVGLPSTDEALQILCTYAFGQKSPKYGFEEIARKVTEVVGTLPSGLRAMGLYLQGKSKEEWENTLPRTYDSSSRDDGKVKPPNIQVFINFRGAELRRTFISHLVDALKRSEINVFIDKHERRGEDVNILFKRIEGSGIAIVVFSNMYSDSKWCLNELVMIKERAHQGLLKVVPIFFKVDVENVKCLKGTFGDNFRDQKYKFNIEESKIKQWKEAIKFISHKLGLVFHDDENSTILESDFVQNVVEEVLKILQDISI